LNSISVFSPQGPVYRRFFTSPAFRQATAPIIPPSDQPGRERFQFATPQPLFSARPRNGAIDPMPPLNPA